MRRRRTPGLTRAFVLITRSGEGRSWIAVSLTLQLLELAQIKLIPQQTLFLRATLCSLLAWAAGAWIKKAVNRPRPVDPAVPAPSCRSFPSSHASASIALFVALSLTHHPLAPLVGAWALGVSISRFYLGVHFPGDLLGGAALGTACGFCILCL